MKTYFIRSISLLALFFGCAIAADEPSHQATNLIDAVKLNGKSVQNLQGQDLGSISQLLIDPQSGRVRYAVLQMNKTWQAAENDVAVPWGAFQFSGKPEDPTFRISLDATREKLENAPKYKVGDAERLFTRQSGEPVYTYWAIVWVDDPAVSTSGSKPNAEQNRTPSTTGSNSQGQPATEGSSNSQSNPRPGGAANQSAQPSSQ
jgi:sporulation protein YlmC with PRC-barrel domain